MSEIASFLVRYPEVAKDLADPFGALPPSCYFCWQEGQFPEIALDTETPGHFVPVCPGCAKQIEPLPYLERVRFASWMAGQIVGAEVA